MRSFVIGTAGHIDHGKSALIKALTGTDPDRLAEEKSRGITIDLGFAHLELAEDLRASVVDVPGHERFVKNMVAGTGGIDLVLMVVAADEGIMPQTREHLDICQLLGVGRGVVALTKTDLVEDPDWLEMVSEDVRKEFAGTFLEEAPIVPVSSRTGAGLDALRATLDEIGRDLAIRPGTGLPFLAIDRSFSMRGFGTVVTGTLVSGRLRIEDAVDVIPDPTRKLTELKIRGLQSHGSDQQEVSAGLRLAINLSGVEKAALHRGQVLVHAGSLQAGTELEVRLKLLPGAKPLKTRKRMLFHTGTSKVSAALQLIGTRTLNPGEQAFVRVRCEEPIAALPGHHFILRGFSPIPARGTTFGGGRILAILPPRRKQRDLPAWIEELETLDQGGLPARLAVLLDRAGPAGLDLPGLAQRSGASLREVERELERMLATRLAFKFDREHGRYTSAGVVAQLAKKACDLLAAFHAKNPLLPGMPTEQLRGSLDAELEPKLLRVLLAELTRDGQAVQSGDHTRLVDHQVRLDADGSQQEQSLLDLYRQAGLAPPRLSEAASHLDRPEAGVRDLLKHLARTGTLTHLTADMYISTGALDELQGRLVKHLEEHSEIDTQAFKKMVGASRKHVIPLAEYFDRQKVTMRVGEKRVLRGRNRS